MLLVLFHENLPGMNSFYLSSHTEDTEPNLSFIIFKDYYHEHGLFCCNFSYR